MKLTRKKNKEKIRDRYEYNCEFTKKVGNNMLVAPFRALESLEAYIKEHENDYHARIAYAYHLITIGDVKEAEEMLDYTQRNMDSDRRFNKKSPSYLLARKNMITARIKLLSFKEEYGEVLKYMYDNKREIIDNEIDTGLGKLYARTMAGLSCALSALEGEGYKINQIIDYSEERFIDHIQKHLSTEEGEILDLNVTKFNSDFPFDEVFSYIKGNLNVFTPLFFAYVEDTYYFKFDHCGKIGRTSTDYFKLVAFHNKPNFITMYPTLEGRFMPYTDINALIEDKPKTKIYKPE